MSGEIPLSQLDAYVPAELDPAVLSRNLYALREIDGELAALLDATRLPATWRVARAIDGSVTFRVESAGEPARWLGDTAAPQTRAAGLLADAAIADRNVALLRAGVGAELALLLDQTGRHQAVYVFENDAIALRALLSLRDVSGELRAMRAILLWREDPGAQLTALLRQHPGLAPPASLIRLPAIDAARVHLLQTICEQCGQVAARERREAIERLRSSPEPAVRDARGVAIVSLGASPGASHEADRLERAIARDGRPACHRALRSPSDALVLPHVRALAEFAPAFTLFVDTPHSVIPISPPGQVAEWWIDAARVPESLPADDAWRLAASPSVAAALRAAGAREDRVREWLLAADSPTTSPATEQDDAVWLVADLPDDRAEAAGVTQPTHVRLWAAARSVIAAAVETAEISRQESLLRASERAGDTEIRDAALRRHWLALLARVLIPASVLETIVRALQAGGMALRLIGGGWSREPRWASLVAASDAPGLSALCEKSLPIAVVFAGRPDPLSPALIRAAQAGCPVVLHAPGGVSLNAKLGGVLLAGSHFVEFSAPRELRDLLRRARSDRPGALRRATQAREHLARAHSLAQRLADLSRVLRP
ncbi:MAG: hypothetical protein U1D55_01640 [Phycisphaerae bacterium]